VHYTDIESAKRIISLTSPGFRASTQGQGGGGFYVCKKPPHEMGWSSYQGGKFRETVGRKLWGEKYENVLEGGSDAEKLDVVFFLKVPNIWVEQGILVPGRDCIAGIRSAMLYSKDEFSWLQKDKIVKGYILKKGAQTFGSEDSAEAARDSKTSLTKAPLPAAREPSRDISKAQTSQRSEPSADMAPALPGQVEEARLYENPKAVGGLAQVLQQINLTEHLTAATEWCNAMGADSVQDLQDSEEGYPQQLAQALHLPPIKAKKLAKAIESFA